MEETIIKTSKIYEGRVVKLDVHEVRLPNGEYSKREQIQHPGAAAVVAIDAQGQVLLVRQYRLPARSITLELPAGTLIDDEVPELCAARELQEEAGYRPGALEPLGGFYVAPGYTTEFIYLFMTQELYPSTLTGDDDEFIEVVRIPFDEALEKVENGEIIDSKTIIGLYRAANRLR